MNTEQNNQAAPVEQPTDGGEVEVQVEESNVVNLSKDEYDKMLTDLGSLKREKKDWVKAQKEVKETPQQTNPDELSSLQNRLDRQTLRAAEVTHEDDVELANKVAKDLGKSLDDVVESDYFLFELEKQRTKRANTEATSNVKGDKAGGTSAKNTPEYWIALGRLPTREEVPSRADRKPIREAFMKQENKTGMFYND